MRFFVAALLLLAASAFSLPLQAEDQISRPMPERFDPSYSGSADTYIDALKAAWAGDCSPALELAKFIPPKYSEETLPEGILYAPMLSLHMLDRAICVDFDPERVTRYLSTYIPTEFAPHSVQIDMGWRYWHGYGVPQDREKARRLFDIGLIADWTRFDDPNFAEVAPIMGYPLPSYAKNVAAWILDKLENPETRLAFLIDVARGGGTSLPPGRPPTRNADTASVFLKYMDTTEALYARGILGKHGLLDWFENQDWLENLEAAAFCFHSGAFLALKEYFMNGDREQIQPWRALQWLYVLDALKYDVSESIEDYERRTVLEDPHRALDYQVVLILSGKECAQADL